MTIEGPMRQRFGKAALWGCAGPAA